MHFMLRLPSQPLWTQSDDTAGTKSADTEPAKLAPLALSHLEIIQYEKAPELAAIHRFLYVNGVWRAASVSCLKRWFIDNAWMFHLDFTYWTKFAGINSVVNGSGIVTISFA